MKNENIIITIGRQLGSGGSMMGKIIAEHFGFRFIDKEFLVKAAEILHYDENSLETLDEKVPSWAKLAQAVVSDAPYFASDTYRMPTSEQIFNTQARIMKDAAERSSCVIVGRCSSYLFRNYPKCASIFLQADIDSRIKRLEKTLGTILGKKELEKEDKARAKYYNRFTGHNWMDLTEYDLVLDTTSFMNDQICEILFDFIKAKFPELK